jgi:hypothetical protein
VTVGDRALRDGNHWDTIWRYEAEALQGWLSGDTREELADSSFARGGAEYWVRHRATKFMNRTTQQYAYALSSLLFFTECQWRERDPAARDWSRTPRELGLQWEPHFAHLPLAVKWGVRSLSALAWILAGVRFRFAANYLGEMYPSYHFAHDLERQLEMASQLLADYRRNHEDGRAQLTVEALKTQSDSMALDYDFSLLSDVAEACCIER